MKISLNWLRQYLEINTPIDELVNGLINLGIEVESVENQAENLNKFVIGKVIERKKHPNADKLSVCKVDAGTGEILNIVCGAPNVDAGHTVCVALVGAIVPNGQFEIKKAKLRGEVSEGMICSAKELNLGDDHSGIMVLDTDLPIGTPFGEYLGQNDVIIEIGITPNRGDLLSHLGIAVELGALLNQKVSEPALNINISGGGLKGKIMVEIKNPNGCNRYCGILVNDVTVKESPDWLKSYLTSVGLRPINNIVDITNYVMLECGQPLHAFDYDKIGGKKIIVEDAGDTKKFVTLDGKERELRNDILLICDAEKPVALAGIMGGANSEISDSTKNVFIESAYFNPVLTRKSSKFLGLQTDSSYRFERGVDIDRTEWACKRAAALICELGGGKIVNGFIDEYPAKFEKLVVDLRISQLNRITGIEFTKEQTVELLGKINIPMIREDGEKLYFEIPQSRREDLQREIDLIEEVIRLHGYEKISISEYDKISLDVKEYFDKETDFINNIKKYLVGGRYHEVVSNSLVDEKIVSSFRDDYISLINPSSSNMTVLRTNLYSGLFDIVKANFEHMNNTLRLFEVGNTFSYGKDGKVSENKSLLLALAGEYDVESTDIKPRYFDLLDIKAELKALLEKLNIANYNINYYNYKGNFEFQLEYEIKGNIIANISKFSSKFLKKLDIEKPVLVCEIPVLTGGNFSLYGLSRKKITFNEYSNYPPVIRDLSIACGADVKEAQIEQEILSTPVEGLLKKLRLYDIYEMTESGKKSYTYSLEFRADEKTLTSEEVNKLQEKIVQNLAKKLGAELRK
jgi:phenylalanyl-tRNA synthetase beta chain